LDDIWPDATRRSNMYCPIREDLETQPPEPGGACKLRILDSLFDGAVQHKWPKLLQAVILPILIVAIASKGWSEAA
jgi:hypothetical protein